MVNCIGYGLMFTSFGMLCLASFLKGKYSTQEERKGYTLTELLVVMMIIVFLAGLLIYLWPGLSSSASNQSAADRVQGLLLIAKQRAIRDRRPTGVRLVLPNVQSSIGLCNQLVMIQQPDNFTGSSSGGWLQPSKNPASTFTNVDFTGGLLLPTDWLVQNGDYLEINGGGLLHPVVYVTANQLTTLDTIPLQTATNNWRVIRQPRLLGGETPLQLPGSAVIDLTGLSLNVPVRANATDGKAPPLVFCEIMFSPAGNVIGTGISGNDKIVLWVRDSSLTDPTANSPVLIGIQINTGFIGSYPVDISKSGGDWYSNTRDPHACGL